MKIAEIETGLTFEMPVATHNWPVQMFESVVRDSAGEPVAVAVRRTEHEAIQVARLIVNAKRMAAALELLTKHVGQALYCGEIDLSAVKAIREANLIALSLLAEIGGAQ